MPESRIVLLVSLWLRSDDVAGFEAFERKVSAIQAQHGGRIERAIRLAHASGSKGPFEVHIVSFPNTASLAAYRADKRIAALAAERERLIARTEIVEGRDVAIY